MRALPAAVHLLGLGVTLFLGSVGGLYTEDGPVTLLDDSNFQELVIDSDKVWIVEFFAPWCGHCKQLAPDYAKVAKSLEGILGVGAVDCDAAPNLCGAYGVQGFPTIKGFEADRQGLSMSFKGRLAFAEVPSSEDELVALFGVNEFPSLLVVTQDGSHAAYDGQLKAQALTEFLEPFATEVKQGTKPTEENTSKEDQNSLSSIVVEAKDFKAKIIAVEPVWVVAFIGEDSECKATSESFWSAAKPMAGMINVAAINMSAPEGSELAAEIPEVQGCGSVLIYPYGEDKSQPNVYEGEWDRKALEVIKLAGLLMEMWNTHPCMGQAAWSS
eukprot:scaffold4595_cov415-Prasinococcus_capsulatus_cf.AAC.9